MSLYFSVSNRWPWSLRPHVESIYYSQSNIGKFETIKFTDTQNDSTELLFVIMDKPGVTSLISFTRHVGTYNAHTNSCHQFCRLLPYKHCTLPSLRLSFFSNLSWASLRCLNYCLMHIFPYVLLLGWSASYAPQTKNLNANISLT